MSEARLRRILRKDMFNGWQYRLWKPRGINNTGSRYWIVEDNTCVDGADDVADLIERWENGSPRSQKSVAMSVGEGDKPIATSRSG